MISKKSISGEIVRDDLGENEQTVAPRTPGGLRGDVSIAKITPPKCVGLLPRERLYRQLDASGEYPITWLAAPAGSGKTTLISAYLADRKTPRIWYRVDQGDADIATFFYYMGLAAEKAAPHKRPPLPLLTSEYMLGIVTFTMRYFESLYSRLKSSFVIVFDNYQHVPAQSGFHQVIREGLGILPEELRVIIVSREPPPPQFGPLRAKGEISFLEEMDIRFTHNETKKMVRLKGIEKLSDTILDRLHARTQGWAAGLVLMTECLKRTGDDSQAFSEPASEETFDFFATEVLAKTDRETNEFLLKTALLPGMTAITAERLTGIGRSRQILTHLHRNNYFTQKYHNTEPVYQYHPLFRVFLRSCLHSSYGRDEILSLKRQAAVILAESGDIEDAAELLRDTEQWEDLIRIILSQAQSLVQQGRTETLNNLLKDIPAELKEEVPWLSYWNGVCRLLAAPPQARSFFERAFHLFLSREDETGALLAWSGVVDSIFYEGDDFTLFDQWIDWLIDRAARDPLLAPPEIEMVVVSSLALALLYRRPDHPDLAKWMERAVALSSENAGAQLGFRMQVQINAQIYYGFCGEVAKCMVLAEESEIMAGKETDPPLAKIMQKAIESAVFMMFHETCGRALQAVYDGLDLANETGVHMCDPMLIAYGSYTCLSLQCPEKGIALLRKLEGTVEHLGRFHRSLFNYLTGWHHLVAGDTARAALYATESLNLAVAAGISFPEMIVRLLLAETLAEKGESIRAKEELKTIAHIARKTGSWLMEYFSLLCEAHIVLDSGDDRGATRLLERAFSLGRVKNFRSLLFWWRPAKMARLCMKALEAGLEEDFVQSLVRELKLVPEKAPVEIENWPWPLRIYALGRFEVQCAGRPVEFAGKRRQIELLKALLSLGGTAVRPEQLIDILWPDAQGDYGHNSFKVTLSRLRRFLPDEAIDLHDGLLTLNRSRVWTDIHSFERLAEKALFRWDEIHKTGAGDVKVKQLAREALSLTGSALALYRGPFLVGDHPLSWTVSMRERLRSRFVRLTTIAGQHLEGKGRWKSAVALYVKALEAENFHEQFYQRLMVCHRELGNRADALAVYECCRAQLAAALHVSPSPSTEALYAALRPE